MKNGILFTIAIAVWSVLKLIGKLIKTIIWALTNIVIFFGLYYPLFYLAFGLILLATTDFSFGVMGTNQILYFVGLGLCGVVSVMVTIRTFVVRPIAWIFEPFRNYLADIRAEKQRFALERGRGGAAEGQALRPAEDRRYYEDERYLQDPRYGERRDYPPYEQRWTFSRDGYRERVPADQGYSGGYQSTDPYYPPRQDYPREEYPRDGYPPREERRDYPRDDYSSGYPARDPYARDPYAREPYPPREEYPTPAEPLSYPVRNAAEERPLIYYSRRRPGVLVKEYSDRFELYEETSNGRQYVGTEYKDD